MSDERVSPRTDADRVKHISRTVGEFVDGHWDEVDELWLRQIKPLLRVEISDEDFIKRLAAPLSLRLISIGIQAGLEGVLSAAPVFDGPARVVVAPSGTVSIKLLDPE